MRKSHRIEVLIDRECEVAYREAAGACHTFTAANVTVAHATRDTDSSTSTSIRCVVGGMQAAECDASICALSTFGRLQ